MKNLITSIAVILSVILATYGKDGDNIYVYRNDGQFNAFYSSEVDSIRSSCIDLDGVKHGQPVVNEIFTADSVYRIPLSAIDSISYRTPETRLNSRVKLLDNYVSYIVQHDKESITFSSPLPADLKISKGDVLVYSKQDEKLPEGFAGVVSSIEGSGETTVAHCKPASIRDVYDALVAVVEYNIEEDPADKTKLRLVPRGGSVSTDVWQDVDADLAVNRDGISVTGNVGWAVGVRLEACIDNDNDYFKLYVVDEMNMSASAEAQKSVLDYTSPYSILRTSIPGLPMFYLDLKYGTFCKADIDGSMSVESRIRNERSVTYMNGNLVVPPTRTTATIDPNIPGDLNGSLWLGLNGRVELSTIGDLLKLGVDVKAGPKFDANISVSGIGSQTEGLYDRLSSMKVSVASRVEGSASFDANFGNVQRSYSTPALGYETSLADYYLVPRFYSVENRYDGRTPGSGDVVISSRMEPRQLLFPCQAGFSLTDKGGRRTEYLREEPCTVEDNTISNLFESLPFSGRYTARPLVSVLGKTFDAYPEKSFVIGAEVNTLGASADCKSALVEGRYSLENGSSATPTKAGFCYSNKNEELSVDRCLVVMAAQPYGETVSAELKNLSENTTYYYAFFITIDGKTYYGDTQCFTTTRSDVSDPGPQNPGGDYRYDETSPVAVTTGADNVNYRDAILQLSFSNIAPDTECGYFMEGENSEARREYVSLGTVAGNMRVPVSGLTPDTQYWFAAYAENSYGKSYGEERSFKTKSYSAPSVKIVSVKEVKDISADVTVQFSDLNNAVSSPEKR